MLNDKEVPLIRPANYPDAVPGRGYQIVEVRTKKVLIIILGIMKNGRL